MKERLQRLLGVEPTEFDRVFLLLIISFFIGLFRATVLVASQSLFLDNFSEADDLPLALVHSGLVAIVITGLFNILIGKIPFSVLASGFLVLIISLTALIEFGDQYVQDPKSLYYAGFVLVPSFTFVVQLVFWGSFGRIFNLRQQKKVIGKVDVGIDVAQIISFFSIPLILSFDVATSSLYSISLVSGIIALILFGILANRHLGKISLRDFTEKDHQKITVPKFLSNKYILALTVFVVSSFAALRFIDYSFFNVVSQQFTADELANFLSLFEGTIIVFGFLFTTFFAERVADDYGLRVAMLVNPLLLILFTAGALLIGATMGYEGDTMIYFFIMIAMSKLFVNSLKDALDEPTFKLYYVPINKALKLDAQTKLEGMITALATVVGGGLIILIRQFEIFDLLSITLFTLPILAVWYWSVYKMYNGYKSTLQDSLVQNKLTVDHNVGKEYTLESVLEKEVSSSVEDKVIYGLRLMETLEPALFESAVLELAKAENAKIRAFARQRVQQLKLDDDANSDWKRLALKAAGEAESNDVLSISPDRLAKMAKSVKQSDRVLAAKLLRGMMNQKTIFTLLELLRDPDPKVRHEAIFTARKAKKPETWGILIELLGSPVYAHAAAAALKEAGVPALASLETAFHKSGQSDLVMLKIVQIIGHIGGTEAVNLLWKKVDYPDKRIVKQILFSLRYINYQAKGREVVAIKELLDIEMSKTLWNLAALEEIPSDREEFFFLRQAIREEVAENYDQITLLLSLLYDPDSVQLVRENLQANTPDSIQYALELLNLFVDIDLKPKLIPLLDDSRTQEKLDKLQTFFPRENYSVIQVINYVINRDFNYNNRWSKACAVHAAAFVPDFRISRGLIGQLFNTDKIIQETAAWVIFNKDKTIFNSIIERLPQRDQKFVLSSIENKQLLDGLDDGFYLYIEMVMFIKRLPQFANVPGNLLTDLSDKIIPIELKTHETMALKTVDEEMPILIVALGEVALTNNSQHVMNMRKGDVFGDLFYDGALPEISTVTAQERSIVFKISMTDFYFVLAKHHELVQALIQNATNKSKSISQY